MKAFIFDLDGTLLDTLEDIGQACNNMLTAHGLPVHTPDAYRRMVGNGFTSLVRASLPRHYAQTLTPAAVEALVQEARDDYAAHMSIRTRPYAGMPETLRELAARGFRLGVLSNKPDDLTNTLVSLHFSEIPFAVVRGSRADTPLKPEPAGALAVAAALSTAPEDCRYVGDSDVDMLTARNAGMCSVGVAWGFRGLEEVRRAGAQCLVHSPAELLGLCTAQSNETP